MCSMLYMCMYTHGGGGEVMFRMSRKFGCYAAHFRIKNRRESFTCESFVAAGPKFCSVGGRWIAFVSLIAFQPSRTRYPEFGIYSHSDACSGNGILQKRFPALHTCNM